MRQITSKEKESKKQKKNQLIIGILLIIVLFGSVFGIIVNSFGKSSSSENLKYGGEEFVYQNKFWILENDRGTFYFLNNPSELNRTGSEIQADLNDYSNKPLYIYSEDSGAELEIYRNLFRVVERIQGACPSDKICEEDIPTKDCLNNFIIIKESSIESITQENGCVYISGEKENLIKISDDFLLGIIGVKE